MESMKWKLERLENRTKWLIRIVKGKGKGCQIDLLEMKPVATPRTLPQLPIEVWENVIGHLWDDQVALRQCIFVCRAWYPPSLFYLHRRIEFKSVEGVEAYAEVLKQTPELSNLARDMAIFNDPWRHRIDLSELSLRAAILLARKLSRLERLDIGHSEWYPSTMDSDISQHLSGFSVTRLGFYDVIFPSITVFGRLICALPGLVELDCYELKFKDDHFDRDEFGLYCNRVLKIRSLRLDYLTPQFAKLFDFLAHPCISSRLQRLLIGSPLEMTDSQFQWTRCQPLLNAASGSLSELQLNLHRPRGWLASEVLAADLVLFFTHNTSLQRLWLIGIDISQESDLNTFYQVLLSIGSGQLREIVIVFGNGLRTLLSNWFTNKVKNIPKNREPTHQEKIDTYLSSDSFGMLSKVEFALSLWAFDDRDDPSAAVTAVGEQWKRQLAPSFPRLTERGIFRATVKRWGCEYTF